MAKKTVAAGGTKAEKFVKTIRMVRSPKSGAYSYKEEMVSAEKVTEFFTKKGK